MTLVLMVENFEWHSALGQKVERKSDKLEYLGEKMSKSVEEAAGFLFAAYSKVQRD